MLNISQFRHFIIKQSLNAIQAWSQDAEELLVFTCAVESLGGTYIHQVNGPALGIYQMEPDTHNDIWENYIKKNPSLNIMIQTNLVGCSQLDANRLIYDLQYATIMARLHYMRVKEPLPSSKNIEDIWAYYKKYYNTEHGKSLENIAISKYYTFTHSHPDNSQSDTA